MIKEAIAALVEGKDLTFEEASGAMNEIMNGEAAPSQVASFLTALRMKGETAEEIAGLASVMREKSLKVELSCPAIDIVGTGGDGSGSFNISTAAAFVAVGAGVKVAKHGNRAASSKCGSADVLEALGVKIDLPPEGVKRCVEECGIGFMFAQVFHPAMKYVAPVRREIGVRTVFNILGPLTNPAGVRRIVLGVPSKPIGDKIARVLGILGTERAFVVHGCNGLDELSVSSPSFLWDIGNGGDPSANEVTPEDFGCGRYEDGSICGGNAQENAAALRGVLDGFPGPFHDAVVMNAAAGLLAAGAAETRLEAANMARESITSAKAREKLEALIMVSQSLK